MEINSLELPEWTHSYTDGGFGFITQSSVYRRHPQTLIFMFSVSLFVFSDCVERFIQFVLHKGRSCSEFRSLNLHCLSVNIFFGSLD